MKKIIYFTLISLIVTLTGCIDMPDMDHDIDTEAPYVKLVRLQGITPLNISPEDNANTLSIKNTKIPVREKQENKVDYPTKFFITFSEPIYFKSVQEFGKSDTVVLIEAEEFSRSFLNDINSAPLSDSNSAKKLPVEISGTDADLENGATTIVIQARQYERDEEGNIAKDKYGQIKYNPLLKYGTKYALIVSKDVVDMNGKNLTVLYDDQENNKIITTQDSFVLLFETEPLPVAITKTAPVAAPEQGSMTETAYNQLIALYKETSAACPNLKNIEIHFDDDMDPETINSQTLTISPAVANTVSYSVVEEKINEGKDNEETIEHYVAKMTLSSDMATDTEYKVTLKNTIKSKRGASISVKDGSQYLVADGFFRFWTDDELLIGAPVIATPLSSSVVGNVIKLNWSTTKSSTAEIKFSNAQGNESYDTVGTSHSFTTTALTAGEYTLQVTPINPCDGTRGTPLTTTATIESHPIITEVSPNATHPEYVEVYNIGNNAIDLSNYKIVIGTEVLSISGHDGGSTSLPPGDYAVIVEKGYTDGDLSVAGGAIVVEVDNVDITTKEDVSLTYNGNTVSSYTHDFSSTSSKNFTAQRTSLTSDDFCESTGTPGGPNVCQ